MSSAKGENSFHCPLTLPKPSHSMRNFHWKYESAESESSDTACSVADAGSPEYEIAKPSASIMEAGRYLPPIGVFWDIENCQVPKKKSAAAIVQAIRDRFFEGYREAEFLVVCDVLKEKAKIIEELNYAQINLLHVSATSKNAADEKLRHCIRRFADIHYSPAAIVLISSDINFAGDLSDLRHRKKFHVILVHNDNISEALILCANEHYKFSDIIEAANITEKAQDPPGAEVLVTNLPKEKDVAKIKNRLKQISSNLGGRVTMVSKNVFSVKFPSMEFAQRAQKRMAGEDVFGSKINISSPTYIDEWSFRSAGCRKAHPKGDAQGCNCANRNEEEEEEEEENNFQCNSSSLSDMEPPFQEPTPKSISPTLSNNSSKFTLPKVPNIENLRIIQNPTSSNQKLNLNNSETYAGILGNDVDQRKQQQLENMKLTNFFKNQQECPVLRLNNATSSNNESGMNSVDGNPLLQAQGQKLQLLAQNAAVQRNIALADPLAQQLPVPQMNKTNGSIDSAAGHVIRGVHGVTINDNNYNNSSNGIKNKNSNNTSNNNSALNNDNLSKIKPIEEDCESTYSADDFFEPIQKPASGESKTPVDLHISGLDPYMDLLMTKNFLTSMFKMHVQVISVSVFCLTDGNVVASVKVPTLQDAQYAISQLQRRQIGSRRITIAFQNSSKCHRQILRAQVSQLLEELPQNKIPLFRFTELFKSRFLNSISVSELKKMKDVCVITEEENGRMISANNRCQLTIMQRQEKKDAIIPYCQVHAQKALSDTEQTNFPTVRMGLSILGKRIEILLDSHCGRLPLASLSDCYEANFGALPEDSEGVPLEHLVSCLPKTEIVHSQGSFKYLTWSATSQDHAKSVSPMLVASMSVFTREALDLLKDTPKCILPFSQFIPSYHRRYGRQCRVSDYGFTKLVDLLESLPHVLQVMGNGSYKMVTLSHKAQIRRFTSDLVRILKNQTNKQLELSNFQTQYERITGRVWDPCYYGLCELEDLLNCIPQTTVMKDVKDGQVVISIPKREQTPEEVELTKKFAVEVVELLKRVPNCSMAFNRFVPAYHNQFGRQCRVSSYGCFKLIELFEAIPDTVNVEENASRGEKYVVLTPAKRLQVLAERVCQILAGEGGSMPLIRLEFVYKFYQYDSVVSPSDNGCETFLDLLQKISQYIQIEDSRNGLVVVLKNDMDPNVITCRIRYILFEKDKLSINQFLTAYSRQYGQNVDILAAINNLPQVVKIIKKGPETYIQLTSLSVFANQMYMLLADHRGRISLPSFESIYLKKFKKPCQPSQFGYATISSLLSAIPETVILQNSGYYTHKRVVTLNTNLKNAGFALPVLNNENNSQRVMNNGLKTQENSPPTYDLWKSDSVFSAWNVINTYLPENVTVPHPSELPIPSPKLASPLHQRMLTDSELRHETEATPRNAYENGGDRVEVADRNREAKKVLPVKKKNRIAAQFDNNLI